MTEKDKNITVCITGDIDIGKLETIDCLKKYFDMLERNNISATIPVTAKVVKNYPERIDYILKRNHEVAGHGDVHKPFYGSVNKQYKRLKDMMNTFKDVLDVEIIGFRAPWYKHDKNTYIALDRAGLLYDSSKKRFEIALKRIPSVEKKYLDSRYYNPMKPFLRLMAKTYNYISRIPNCPYYVTKNVLEIPVLGISDFSLIYSKRGPQYQPEDYKKIADIWLENLGYVENGGILVIQAHPGGVSPQYISALEYFIRKSKKNQIEFKTLRDITKIVLNDENKGCNY